MCVNRVGLYLIVAALYILGVLCIYLHPVCVCVYIYMRSYIITFTQRRRRRRVGRDKHYQMEGRLDNIRNMED